MFEFRMKRKQKQINEENKVNQVKPLNPILKYPFLFHKYLLQLRKPQPIPYKITKRHIITNEFICHLHIFDLDKFDSIYGEYINNLLCEYDIVVTFVHSTKQIQYPVTFIQIKNQGFDVGGKLCCLQYLKDINHLFHSILFLHSKTDSIKRKQYFHPLIKNINRIKLCKLLVKYKNISGIFPNLIWDKNNSPKEYDVFACNELYYNELSSFLNIKKNYCFSEGNCFLCTKKVIDSIFTNYILFYNILNDDTSFDYNWFSSVLKIKGNLFEVYKKSLTMKKTSLMNIEPKFRDGMIEHAIERMWIDAVKQLDENYLVLDEKNLIDMYDIKVNAIYFPQYHKIPENDTFWGNGFTEWTLLKPFDKTLILNNISYPTLKPHSDIGYYELTKKNMKKQIEMAEKFNIHGFILYHYWFGINHKVMYKPLEYFLKDLTFPFAISWANETWSKRWDGSENEVMIQQSYPKESYLAHIHYLIPFFKLPNYMKNDKQECIFYVYKLTDIPKDMIPIWEKELQKYNLKIKIINTENSYKETHNFGKDNFVFEPMYSSIYVPLDRTEEYMSMNYNDIIEKYKSCSMTNKHLGLPLYWNNKVRRKNNIFLTISNFKIEKMEELLLLLLAELVSKYKNRYKDLPAFENFINVNAWNEWNEQAVLEPNTVTGYDNLTTIHKIISDL